MIDTAVKSLGGLDVATRNVQVNIRYYCRGLRAYHVGHFLRLLSACSRQIAVPLSIFYTLTTLELIVASLTS
ncbi:hypothetical protein AcV5_000125 [Taiwanofungus camphoratus]|nr:hypothetical protein AcV5_000125 [Antrodia cinnamomea]